MSGGSSGQEALSLPAQGEPSAAAESQPIDHRGALEHLPVPTLVADRHGLLRLCNAAAGRLFGISPDALMGRPLSDIVPERFRAAHQRAFTEYVDGSRPAQLVGGPPVRMFGRRADGSEVVVEVLLRPIGRPGAPDFSVVASLHEVPDPEIARRPVLASFLQAIVEAAPDGVLAISPDRKVLAVNRRFCEIWRLPDAEVAVGGPSPALSRSQRDLIVDPDAFEGAIRWGHEHPAEPQTLDVALTDGRVVEGYAAPIVDDHGDYLGRVWYMHDATERRAGEQQRAELTERLAAAERSQRFLLKAAAALARTSGFEPTLRALAETAVPTLGDLCLIDVLEDSGEVARKAAVHHDRTVQPVVDRLLRWPPDPQGGHPSIAAMAERRSRMSTSMSEEFLAATTRGPDHLTTLQLLNFRSYMAVPLIADGAVLGAVTFISSGSERLFTDHDLALAENFADQTARVVAKERRYDLERQAAHTLQSNLLPLHVTPVPGLDIALRYLPGTRDAEVGGDFWDCVALPGDSVALVIGDVSGHDMVAAAQMAQLRAVLRAMRPGTSGPGELLGRLQEAWPELGLDRLVTLSLSRLDLATGALRLVSAGHPPPLLVTPGHAHFVDVPPAPPLGSLALPPEEVAVDAADAAVVFYTDGLVESRDQDIEAGMAALAAAAEACPDNDPERLADAVLTSVTGADRSDDIAVMVVRRRRPGT